MDVDIGLGFCHYSFILAGNKTVSAIWEHKDIDEAGLYRTIGLWSDRDMFGTKNHLVLSVGRDLKGVERITSLL